MIVLLMKLIRRERSRPRRIDDDCGVGEADEPGRGVAATRRAYVLVTYTSASYEGSLDGFFFLGT